MTQTARKQITRALISVYDKTGLVELASALADNNVEIVSTGSTAKTIAEAGISVTPVEDVTGFPECLEGRVKTLHPRVHAGILADTRKADHLAQLEELDVAAFQLVVVNLYPFTETVASGADFDACVEQIDIGGPSMVRAAAKNHPSVAVVVDPARYGDVARAVAEGGFSLQQRTELAAQAFQHTAAYDVAVATWMSEQLGAQQGEDSGAYPQWMGRTFERAHVLRYGENPHQSAALYTAAGERGLAQATQLPGIAVADDIAAAHRAAHACDPVSAFGGVIAANREVSVEMAKQVAEIFTEVIIAPSYEDGAVEVLQAKKNIRILVSEAPNGAVPELRQISGGMLVQERDRVDAAGDDASTWTLAAGQAADPELLSELEFAWRAVRAVKSNAILLAREGATVGVGMGQVNRVDSARLAVSRAGEERARGSVAASDAFFPFADGFEVLAEAGVKAVVQPGGSIRDEEVIAAAQKAGVTMYFTGTRHFAH